MFRVIVFTLSIAVIAGCATSPSYKIRDDKAELVVGNEAPDFWLKNQNQVRTTLSQFKSRKNVVLVFFPLAFTPV